MLLEPGRDLTISTAGASTYPDIRLVYWAGGNPFHHHQDLNRLRKAWQKPDTIIVHESWWTPTARHADIVLPATTTLERNDIGGSSRDRYMFAMHRAIAPVGEARDDFDIFRDLAEPARLRGCLHRGPRRDGVVPRIYERVRDRRARKNVALPGLRHFWRDGFVELAAARRRFRAVRRFPPRDPQRHPLNTPSGQIEICVASTIAGFGYDDCPPHPAWIEPRGMARQRARPSVGRCI